MSDRFRFPAPPGRLVRGGVLAGLLLASALGGRLAAQDLAIVGGEVHTVGGRVLAGATVLVRDGRILEVGPHVEVPTDIETIDADGLVVTPGFIDARTGLGLPSSARSDGRLIRADVAMAPWLLASRTTPHLWLKNGVTAVYVSPDASSLIGGFGSVVKLTADGFGEVLSDAAGLAVSFGDAALDARTAPTTRQGMVGELRQWLIDQIAAGTAEAESGGAVTDGESADRLERVLRREVPLRVVAHLPDDIATAIRLARELGLRLILDGGAGAHRLADTLAAEQIAVVVGPSMLALGGGGAAEMFAHTAENAARLHAAGVPIALSTDAGGGRSVVLEAVVARAHGLSPAAALAAVTLDAARILGVADRIGSVEPGKDADLVVWHGDPVGTWGETRVVVVGGRIAFRR